MGHLMWMFDIRFCMAMLLAILITITTYVANAADPGPLQDFCVGVTDPQSAVYVNGLYCKDPKDVTVDDFIYKGYNKVGDTNNRLRSKVVQVNVTTFPALNSLGVAMGRVDFAPGGLNQPHFHPRASEMLTVVEGTLYAGFISSNQRDGSNKLFAKVMHVGDIFVFPQALIHFQLNIGGTPAVAYVAFGSQNPGLVSVSNALFGPTPPLSADVLGKAFGINETLVEYLQSQFWFKDSPFSYY